MKSRLRLIRGLANGTLDAKEAKQAKQFPHMVQGAEVLKKAELKAQKATVKGRKDRVL